MCLNSKIGALLLVLLFTSCKNKVDVNKESQPEIQSELTVDESIDSSSDTSHSEYDASAAQLFVKSMKAGRSEVAKLVHYPFEIVYPIPPIKDEEEFVNRFDEVFSEELIDAIVNSKDDDWSAVGWRGIMLHNGDLWLDYSGYLCHVNRLSPLAVSIQKRCFDEIKNAIHESLREFEKPVFAMNEKQLLYRVDYLGDDNYRLALWENEPLTMSRKPDLIINDGIMEIEGSMGNQIYRFQKDGRTYTCYQFSDKISLSIENE